MGNFFIFEANASKMFTDNLAKVHNVHTVELPWTVLAVSLFRFELWMCLVNKNSSVIVSKQLNQGGNCSQECFLFICLMVFSHQAVPPSRSSCTPPRNPPTVALSPLSTPAPCWTETWGESLLLSSPEEGLHFYYLYMFVLLQLQKLPVKPAPVNEVSRRPNSEL